MTYFMFLYKFADQAVILFLKWRGSARLVLMTGLYKNRGQFSNDSFCLRVQQVRILLERKNSSSCFHISIFYFVPRITIVSVTKCSNMIYAVNSPYNYLWLNWLFQVQTVWFDHSDYTLL